MKINKLIIGLVVALLSAVSVYLFFSQNKLSNPQPAYAEVVSILGDAKRASKQGGKTTPLKVGNMVSGGEVIETSNKSSITLRFVDDSVALISQNSIVEMKKLLRSGESTAAVTNLYVIDGNVESRVSKQSAFGAEYKVASPALQLSVRGTIFTLKTDKDGSRTVAMVTEGKIIASALGESMDLDDGYGMVLSKDKSLQAAIKLLEAPVFSDLDSVVKYFPINLKWDSLPGAEKYHVQILSGSNYNSIVYEEYISGNTTSLNYLPNNNYKISISGVDGSELEGYSVNYMFKLDVSPAMAPNIISPILDKKLTSRRVPFSWEPSTDAKAYSIEISNSSSFTTIEASIDELPESMNSISVRLKDGKYFWRISSINEFNEKGPYSQTQSFIVSTTK